jgi:hypothetical protein
MTIPTPCSLFPCSELQAHVLASSIDSSIWIKMQGRRLEATLLLRDEMKARNSSILESRITNWQSTEMALTKYA